MICDFPHGNRKLLPFGSGSHRAHYFLVTLIGFHCTQDMKLTREGIGKSGGMTPLQLFSHGIRAEATRRKYTATHNL